MQSQHSTRFNPNHHETPRTPYRIGRAGFEHPRELRLPMGHPPLLTSRPRHGPERLFVGCLPSGLPLAKVRDA